MTKNLLIALVAIISLAPLASTAADKPKKEKTEEQDNEKVQFRFGGRVDGYVFTDTYKGVESGGGLQYLMPARPVIGGDGKDANAEGTLRFGIATTRLNVGAAYNFTEKFRSSAFVEIDFMGAGGANPLNLIRLRHAFLKLEWTRDELLVGQTSHLMLVDQIAPSTVIFGAGYPINPLSRPIQVRYTHQFGNIVNLAVAASMFAGTEGQMQSVAMTPDIALRVMVGDPSRNMIGAAGSFKSIEPRMEVVHDRKARMNALSGAIFGIVHPIPQFSIRAFGIVGQDLQTLGMTGMFAPVQGGTGYSPSTTVSAWVDLAGDVGCGFSVGLFGGYQKNIGTFDPIITADVITAADQLGVDFFYRISPRVWYTYKKLSFGLEYLFTQASWAEKFDQYYLPETLLPIATNHRVSLMARFNF